MPFKNDLIARKRCKVRRIMSMRKDVIATGQHFHLGNVRVVNRSVVLQEAGGAVGVNTVPLAFDSFPQFL